MRKINFLLIAAIIYIFYAPKVNAMKPASPTPSKPEIKKYEYTTFYKDGKEAKNLDIGIFLDNGQEAGIVNAGQNVLEKIVGNVPITEEFANFIKDKEAAIASACIYKSLFALSYAKTENTSSVVQDFSKIINELFLENNWSIFVTKDNEFIIIIPHSKYPKIKEIKDLSTIGLNGSLLYKFIDYEQNTDRMTALDLYNKLTPKNTEKINIESLINIFLNKTIVNIRAYLTGHGTENIDQEIMAQLTYTQYEKLKGKLNNAGCTFLQVSTCYGGENVFLMKTLNLKLLEPIDIGIKKLNPENFIEVVEGLPGFPLPGIKEKISDFYININNFFEKEKNTILKLIESNQKNSKDKINQIEKNLMNQEILTGKILTSKQQEYSLGKPETYTLYDPSTLLIRYNNIKKSPDFLKIFKDFIYKNPLNIPRAGFPGYTEMSPLKDVFPDLVPIAKQLLTEILNEKQNKLKVSKDFSANPGKITNLLSNLKNLPPEHPSKKLLEYYTNFFSHLESAIKKLEIEIKDIKKYMTQL